MAYPPPKHLAKVQAYSSFHHCTSRSRLGSSVEQTTLIPLLLLQFVFIHWEIQPWLNTNYTSLLTFLNIFSFIHLETDNTWQTDRLLDFLKFDSNKPVPLKKSYESFCCLKIILSLFHFPLHIVIFLNN